MSRSMAVGMSFRCFPSRCPSGPKKTPCSSMCRARARSRQSPRRPRSRGRLAEALVSGPGPRSLREVSPELVAACRVPRADNGSEGKPLRVAAMNASGNHDQPPSLSAAAAMRVAALSTHAGVSKGMAPAWTTAAVTFEGIGTGVVGKMPGASNLGRRTADRTKRRCARTPIFSWPYGHQYDGLVDAVSKRRPRGRRVRLAG